MKKGVWIIIIISLIINAVFYNLWLHQMSNVKRLKQNYESLQLDNTLVRTYTVKEFKRFHQKIDSVAKSVLNVKSKNIKQVVTYDYQLIPDSVPLYYLVADTSKKDTSLHYLSYDYNCLSFKQKINFATKTVDFIKKPEVNDHFIAYTFDKRAKEFKLFKKRFFNYGKKQEHTLIYSECLKDTIKPIETIKIK